MQVDFDDPYLRLDFESPKPLPPPCISVTDVSFGYTEGKTLYEHLNLGVDCDSRIAVIGPNGACRQQGDGIAQGIERSRERSR